MATAGALTVAHRCHPIPCHRPRRSHGAAPICHAGLRHHPGARRHRRHQVQRLHARAAPQVVAAPARNRRQPDVAANDEWASPSPPQAEPAQEQPVALHHRQWCELGVQGCGCGCGCACGRRVGDGDGHGCHHACGCGFRAGADGGRATATCHAAFVETDCVSGAWRSSMRTTQRTSQQLGSSGRMSLVVYGGEVARTRTPHSHRTHNRCAGG